MASFIKSDLEFILQQIFFAERHAAGESLASMLPNPEVPFGLRTIDGTFNNVVPGRSEFGAADNVFPRLTDPVFRTAEDNPFIPGTQLTSYTQTSGLVVDSQPRTISNLIVDMTANNPAAVAAAAQTPGSEVVTATRTDGTTFRDLLHSQRGAGRGPLGAVQPVDDLLRPVLRPRPRSREQGRQRHGLHPAEAR